MPSVYRHFRKPSYSRRSPNALALLSIGCGRVPYRRARRPCVLLVAGAHVVIAVLHAEMQFVALGPQGLGEHVVLADPARVEVVIVILVGGDIRAGPHVGVVPRPVVVERLERAVPMRVAAARVEHIEQAVGRRGAHGIGYRLLLPGLLARDILIPAQVALGRDHPRVLLPILLGPAQDVQPVLAAVLDDGDRAAGMELGQTRGAELCRPASGSLPASPGSGSSGATCRR